MSDFQHFLGQRSFKFKIQIKKNVNSPSSASQEKSKLIGKYKLIKCSQNCSKHRFSLAKIRNNKERQKFTMEKYGVTYNFCPYHNDRIKIHEGGVPHFNNDRSAETPAFSLKFETLINSDDVYKLRFHDELARATNETLYTSNQKYRISYDTTSTNQTKNHEFQARVQELKSILSKKRSNPTPNLQKQSSQ